MSKAELLWDLGVYVIGGLVMLRIWWKCGRERT